MHLAAQYLAAAGISFVEKEADDSHTNLAFSAESRSLETRPLADSGDVLSLNYTNFSLEWTGKHTKTTFALDGQTHSNVLVWIEQQLTTSKIGKPYIYEFHYDLPHKITPSFRFQANPKKLQKLMELRILADTVIKSFLEDHQLSSAIRIWPHHFDTGALINLGGKIDHTAGFGLATPDTMVDDHYFYFSGYHTHNALDTANFNQLTNGQWHGNGFKGAVLRATGVDKQTATTFFTEALNAYMT